MFQSVTPRPGKVAFQVEPFPAPHLKEVKVSSAPKRQLEVVAHPSEKQELMEVGAPAVAEAPKASGGSVAWASPKSKKGAKSAKKSGRLSAIFGQ